jgi:hypothetical protein
MIAGVVKGAKEVAYIKGNLGASGFGASAFVDIYNLRVENGMTPDGQEYNAIANDLRATHVALAPHVRDPENKIKVINAVCVNTDGVVENSIDYKKVLTSAVDRKLLDAVKAAKAEGEAARLVFDTDMERAIDRVADALSPDEYKQFNRDRAEDEIEKRFKEIAAREGVRVANTSTNSRGELINIKEYSMDPKELAALVKNAVDEAIAEKNSDDRMSAMEETLAKHGDALNEINEKLTPKAEGKNGEAFEGKETPEEEKKEAATLENAKPSQEMVKAFSTALNVDFGAQTPSFAALAALAGIKETDPALRIAAVNAKFAEMQKNAPKENQTAAAQNAAGEVF